MARPRSWSVTSTAGQRLAQPLITVDSALTQDEAVRLLVAASLQPMSDPEVEVEPRLLE